MNWRERLIGKANRFEARFKADRSVGGNRKHDTEYLFMTNGSISFSCCFLVLPVSLQICKGQDLGHMGRRDFDQCRCGYGGYASRAQQGRYERRFITILIY